MHNIDCLMDSIAQTITQSSNEGEVLFSTIDLRYAYSQLPLNKDTAKHCNFNIIGGQATGTYRFNTGFYGLTDMPAEFQKAIDITLSNLTNTFSFLDDIIIVTGGGIQNHKEKLFKCLNRLDEENLAINIDKCHFAKKKITWLGYEINDKGIKPIVSKTQAILNLKSPSTQKQLKSFLGSIHHLTKFIPNLANLCKDFRKLLQKDTKFLWLEHHENAFNKIKDNIRQLTENTHFNVNRQTRVKTDASRGGLGAVLEQETCNGWVTIAYASRFLNKAEEKYSINELELLGVVWALEHFKHYLLGHNFTVQTDHRALLSLLKERSSKIHQSRLTRWCDRLIPFTFTIEHIPGSKMGLADYMSRNPNDLPKAPSKYDDEFIIAQINIIKETLNILRKRGRPKKKTIETEQEIEKIAKRRGRPRKIKTTAQDNIQLRNTKTTKQPTNPANKNNIMESSYDYDRNKISTESCHDSTSTKVQTNHTRHNSLADSNSKKTKCIELQRLSRPHNYSLRNKNENNNKRERTTDNDVIQNKLTTQHTLSKPHLPILLHTEQQPTLISTNSNLSNMDKNSKITPPISPAKSNFSMSYCLSPVKSPTQINQPSSSSDPKDRDLTQAIQGIFNSKLIAAMISRDTVLREVRDCILENDEERCRKLCKQIHGQWRNLSTHNGCILVDNKLAIPHAMKEPVMDVLHATHPGAWGMTELGQRLWWPFINRDLINKSKTCRPCTEFGKNLKSIIPKTKWAPLPPCSEPNEEIQIDFGGPIIDGQGREVYFLACIDRFSKLPTLKMYNNANGPNIEKFLNKYIIQHGVPRILRIDQARCLKGNKVQQVCAKHNINIIYAPANDHRPIGLVERLIQTVKRRLGCIKLDPHQKPFNIKNALNQITYELRVCRKKSTLVSPFEAHHGRKPNTALTNATTKPHRQNLDWSNTINNCLDNNIIGQDDLISDDRWELEDLDSDAEVKAAKAKKLNEAKLDKGEIPRTFQLQSSKFEEPLANKSPKLQLARKTNAINRSKKNLQGLYDAVPEGTVLVKTTDATLTLKVPGQKETVLNKADVAKFGTAEQRKIPLINFVARKTVSNHHSKFKQQMENHGKAQLDKILGTRTIRKRDKRHKEPNSKSNLEKVYRTKVPTKKRYAPSPKKGKQTKARTRQSSQSSQDLDKTWQKSQYKDPSDPNENSSDPNEDFEIDMSGLPARKSDRIKGRAQYPGIHQEEDTKSDESSDIASPPPKKQYSGTANFQPPMEHQQQESPSGQINLISSDTLMATTQSTAQEQPPRTAHTDPMKDAQLTTQDYSALPIADNTHPQHVGETRENLGEYARYLNPEEL